MTSVQSTLAYNLKTTCVKVFEAKHEITYSKRVQKFHVTQHLFRSWPIVFKSATTSVHLPFRFYPLNRLFRYC